MRAVLEELIASRDPAGRRPDTRATVARLVADLRAYTELSHDRPTGELLYRVPARERRAGPPGRDRHAGRRGGPREHRPLLRDRPLTSPRCSPTTAAVFVAPHLATLIEAGDDPATAELDPDLDAVAVLTVHKAKGLEFPVVFLPGLVAGRFPSSGRGDPLALPAGLGRGGPADAGAVALAEERRLFYVAMTRARDELILSHAADYGGARARRVSPFVLEALDLPSTAGSPGAGAAASSPGRAAGRRSTRAAGAPDPPRRADHRAAVAELLPGRRLPDLPAQVQVRARPPRPAGAAPRARVRVGAAQAPSSSSTTGTRAGTS